MILSTALAAADNVSAGDDDDNGDGDVNGRASEARGRYSTSTNERRRSWDGRHSWQDLSGGQVGPMTATIAFPATPDGGSDVADDRDKYGGVIDRRAPGGEDGTGGDHGSLLEIVTAFSDGSDGSGGIMFDVQSSGLPGASYVHVRSLEVHVDAAASVSAGADPYCPVTVHTKPGTHRGHETDADSWSVAFNASVPCGGGGVSEAGATSRRRISLDLSPEAFSSARIGPGEVRAFYVCLGSDRVSDVWGTVRYSDAPGGRRELSGADRNLLIRAGTGVGGGLFDGPLYSGRHLNGAVYYSSEGDVGDSASSSPVHSVIPVWGCPLGLATTYEDTTGAFGNMFDVRAPTHRYVTCWHASIFRAHHC